MAVSSMPKLLSSFSPLRERVPEHCKLSHLGDLLSRLRGKLTAYLEADLDYITRVNHKRPTSSAKSVVPRVPALRRVI